MKFKPKQPFVDCPNIRKLLKPQQSPSFEGVDLNGHHPLESDHPLNNWLQSLRSNDNQVDDYLGLPHRE